MKKSLILALALLVGVVSAKAEAPYKHSIGLTLGSYNGISYKTMVKEHFGILAEAGYGVTASPGAIALVMIHKDDSASHAEQFSTEGIWDASVTPLFIYQRNITSDLYWFVGGGPNIGAGQIMSLTKDGYSPLFKMGVSAIAGIEYKMPNLPLAFGCDFRPGSAMMARIYDNGAAFTNYFDWKLNLAVRYCF